MTDTSTDNNPGLKLEEALKAAVSDPEARPAFYHSLMNAQVYVVGRTEPGHEDDQGRPHLQLKQWKQPDGSLAMPFFATMESFRDMFAFSEPHILVPVVDLFRFAGKETTLVMTCPEGSKDFKNDEVEMLLNLVMSDPLVHSLEIAIKNTDEAQVMPLWNDFYSTLVNSRVLVLGKPTENLEENGVSRRQLREGENLSIASWTHPSVEGNIVPFFSSQKIMNECVPAGESFMSLGALEFLNMAAAFDRPLVLNPGYEFNKVFAPQEVKDILAATSQSRRQTAPAPKPAKEGARFLFGRPETSPEAVIEALKGFLPTRPEVRAAYLAVMREDVENAPVAFVFGFESESGADLVPMFEAAAPLVQANAEEGMIIDFTRVARGEDGLSKYIFDNIEPFYLREGVETMAADTPTPSDSFEHKEDGKPGFFRRLKRVFGAG
ncbi:hypothetical protein C4J81_06225 [Deltaproteobacteria bacterium Smac51]|nr:hypothetical protein C4J81_06225 [Deltaproteobacteria bacterium Smac51]